jgi:DNA-binding CsgD family transcriptional regulator
MKSIDRIADLLSSHQKKLEIIAIFLLFCTVGFKYQNAKTQWFWGDYSYIAMLIVFFVLFIAILWIRIEKQKTERLIAEIKSESAVSGNQIEELSLRQREVFDLIAAGKSNKQIMDELSIELSTLKTHINKIYKTLELVSRKQIRAYKHD